MWEEPNHHGQHLRSGLSLPPPRTHSRTQNADDADLVVPSPPQPLPQVFSSNGELMPPTSLDDEDPSGEALVPYIIMPTSALGHPEESAAVNSCDDDMLLESDDPLTGSKRRRTEDDSVDPLSPPTKRRRLSPKCEPIDDDEEEDPSASRAPPSRSLFHSSSDDPRSSQISHAFARPFSHFVEGGPASPSSGDYFHPVDRLSRRSPSPRPRRLSLESDSTDSLLAFSDRVLSHRLSRLTPPASPLFKLDVVRLHYPEHSRNRIIANGVLSLRGSENMRLRHPICVIRANPTTLFSVEMVYRLHPDYILFESQIFCRLEKYFWRISFDSQSEEIRMEENELQDRDRDVSSVSRRLAFSEFEKLEEGEEEEEEEGEFRSYRLKIHMIENPEFVLGGVSRGQVCYDHQTGKYVAPGPPPQTLPLSMGSIGMGKLKREKKRRLGTVEDVCLHRLFVEGEMKFVHRCEQSEFRRSLTGFLDFKFGGRMHAWKVNGESVSMVDLRRPSPDRGCIDGEL